MPTAGKAAQRCTAALQAVTERLGDCVYGIDVNSIEHAVMAKCAKKNIRLAFAESGSAGLAAKRFGNADKEGKLVAFHLQLPPRGDGPGKAGDQR